MTLFIEVATLHETGIADLTTSNKYELKFVNTETEGSTNSDEESHVHYSDKVAFLAVMRIIRLLRIIRLAKLSRHSRNLNALVKE